MSVNYPTPVVRLPDGRLPLEQLVHDAKRLFGRARVKYDEANRLRCALLTLGLPARRFDRVARTWRRRMMITEPKLRELEAALEDLKDDARAAYDYVQCLNEKFDPRTIEQNKRFSTLSERMMYRMREQRERDKRIMKAQSVTLEDITMTREEAFTEYAVACTAREARHEELLIERLDYAPDSKELVPLRQELKTIEDDLEALGRPVPGIKKAGKSKRGRPRKRPL